MHNEAGTNSKPTDGHYLTLSAAEEKKARGRLFQNLKLCWPRIFPENAKVAASDYSEMIPAFCSYAKDLFDAYMNASDLTAIEFQPHVEAIQAAVINRIAPEPMGGLSWGVQIGGLEAVVEWTRTGWLAKLNDSEKWIWRQPATDLEFGKSMVVDEAAKRAGLDPRDIERLRRELSWQDRGYPPRDLHSFMETDLPRAPGEWERYVQISWRRSDHPHSGELSSGVSQRFVEVMREPVHRSTFVSRLVNELYERIDHWDGIVEEASGRRIPTPDGPLGAALELGISEPKTHSEAPSDSTGAEALDDRHSIYNAYKRVCRRGGVKMTETKLANLANPRWNTRDPIMKWKEGKDRAGDDRLIRRAIEKGPPEGQS